MFFDKNKKNLKKCEECGSKIESKFSFCPYCGNNFLDAKKEKKDYGLLGRNDFVDLEEDAVEMRGFGVMDKLVSSMFNNMMKNFDKQFREMEKSEVKSFPNGIKIKISGPFESKPKKKQKQHKFVEKEIDEVQLKKMSELPRTKAKANVKRFGDRIVYELLTPGVNSPEDVFVSKLESGYEVKAIGEKKVYVNSLAVNLPLKKYSILKNKLLVEFFVGSGEI